MREALIIGAMLLAEVVILGSYTLRVMVQARRQSQLDYPAIYPEGDGETVHLSFGPKLFSWPLFCGSFSPGRGWFRIFGAGLSWKDSRRHDLIFSERNGHTRRLRFRSWIIGWQVGRWMG